MNYLPHEIDVFPYIIEETGVADSIMGEPELLEVNLQDFVSTTANASTGSHREAIGGLRDGNIPFFEHVDVMVESESVSPYFQPRNSVASLFDGC